MQTNFKSSSLVATTLVLSFFAQGALAEGRNGALLKRGERLVAVGGCVDCHTPFKMGANGPEKDLSRGMSGHPENIKLPAPPTLSAEWNWGGAATGTAFVGPWGTTYSANLTPDRETGIGSWKESEFIQAMRTGKHIGVARPILPPMPWQGLATLPDKDLRAIYAYLMNQPGLKNKVPDYAPPATASASAGN